MAIASILDSFRHRRAAFWILLGALIATVAFAAYRYKHKPPNYKGVARLQVDLRHPEFLLATRNLAQLPKDIAGSPALAGLVDEQLVFHYEENEERMSLEGVVRRLAYEHDLELGDRFLAALLSAPAEVAFWRSSQGRPEHFIAVVERSALGKIAEALAKIALNDRQLKLVGDVQLSGGTTRLYTLHYAGANRTLTFAGRGDRWVFLSDPQIALDEHGQISPAAATLLGDLLGGGSPWHSDLPTKAGAEHSLVVGARALTADYRRFLPALLGLRLDFDGQSWRPALRVEPTTQPGGFDFTSIWRAVPTGAAFCVAFPVDWKAAQGALDKVVDAAALPTLLDAIDPLAAACWYADSRLNAPVFIARARQPLPPETPQLLATLAAKAFPGALPESALVEGQLRTARIPSRHAPSRSAERDSGERAFTATVGHKNGVIAFSPDSRLVQRVLDVAGKRAPAMADETNAKGAAVFFVAPKRFAQLVRAEVQEVLPQDEEAFFRGVARERLWPRLDAWGRLQAAARFVPGPSAGDGFIALEYRGLTKVAE